MTRAHPLHLSVRALAWAAAAALAGAACNSDDREQFPGSTSGTTEVDPTVVPEFTTAEPMETTMVPEPPPSPKSCRDAIGCALQCAIMIPDPTPPEYPWQECFFTNCLEEINYVEWLKLFDLTECVVEACSATPRAWTAPTTATAATSRSWAARTRRRRSAWTRRTPASRASHAPVPRTPLAAPARRSLAGS
ncbi:hypothetical protein [Nannocystis pusilla]|uniref:hypothetical protein n=1 Tax=Nannocystis pusilla TaxID=889268 RepID=UPI003B7BE9B2